MATKELEELIKEKIAEKIISEMDIETVNKFIREIIVEDTKRIVSSYELKSMVREVVTKQMEKIALGLAQEVMKQPETLEKLKQIVDEGVDEGIKRLKRNVTEKIENTFGHSRGSD